MEKLIEEAKKGNKEAFEALITSVQHDLYRIAKLRLTDKEDVQDAIQETIIIVLQSIKKLKYPQYFKTWVIKILINESNNIYKNKRKIIPFEEVTEKEQIDCSNIEETEKTIDFNFICKDLKYEDKVIMVLYYKEKFTDKEIGRILDLKESTVTTKRNRAKQKIKENFNMGG